MNSIRILLVDDHELVREGLRTVLAARTDWEICGEAVTGREAVQKARELRPNVAVMDFSLPELNGLDATRQIRRDVPETEVLILTMHSSERLAHEALLAGARGFILKSDAKRHLISAIEALAQHQPFLTPSVSGMVLDHYLNPNPSTGDTTDHVPALTPREREIVQLIAEGRTTKEVATTLGVSEKTIEAHRGNILRKLNLHSAVDLVRYAIRNNLIQP
jgi:DNA-binding NarL/FixJ family response regulator